MAIVLGIIGLMCWAFVWIFLLWDIYLTHPGLDIPVRLIAVAAIGMNLTGIVLEIINFRKNRKWLATIVRLALHIAPLMAFGGFAYWLAFGHWM